MDNYLKQHILNISNTFPWYKNLINCIELNESMILDNLPIINQKILEENYYTGDNNLQNAITYKTSGTSTGIKKRIYYSNEDHEMYLTHRINIFRKHLLNLNYKSSCSDLGTGHAAASAATIFKSLGIKDHKIDYLQPIEEHISALNSLQPDVLYIMPMILQKLISTEKLKISPKKIFLVGDIATKSFQENIAAYFNINAQNIIDLYGSIEVGSIAFFNHDIGCYQFDTHIIPEIASIDNHNILLLTSTARKYFPVIRYKTDDIIDKLECINLDNQKVWVFNQFRGRVGAELKLGEKISFYDLINCIEQTIPNIIFDITEHNATIEITLPIEKTKEQQILRLKDNLRNLNFDVKTMINSNLVEDFKINCVPESSIKINHSKRSL